MFQLHSNSVALLIPPCCSKAFEAIIERHEPLRTIFRLEDGELVQIVAEDVHPESQMEIVDLKDFSFDEADRRARDSIAKEVARPFNLSHGPVVRGRLMRLTSSRHYLLIMMHHIVADVQSCGVLLRELSAICQALHEGREFGLAPLELQYGDYAVWQRDTVNSEQFEKCLAYWRNQLRPPIPILSLPYDRPRPSVQSFNGASLTLMVPDAVSAALIELCRRRRVTLFAAALAAYTVLLHRQTGQIDLLIGTPIANRSLHQLEPLIGLFLNTVVLRTKLDPEQPFAALFGELSTDYARCHQPRDTFRKVGGRAKAGTKSEPESVISNYAHCATRHGATPLDSRYRSQTAGRRDVEHSKV